MSPFWRIILITGLIGGLSTLAVFLLLLLVNLDPFQIKYEMLTSVVCFGVIFFGLRNYREDYAGNKLGLSKGILAAFLMNVIIAIITAVYVYIYLRFLDSGTLAMHIQHTKELMEASKANYPPNIYEKLISDLDKLSPRDMAIDASIRRLAEGVFYVIACAIILKK